MKGFVSFILVFIFICPSVLQSNGIIVNNNANSINSIHSMQSTNYSSFNHMNVYYTPVSPNLTDGLKDQVWKDVGYHLMQFQNASLINMTVKFYITYDNNYLYFAFEYKDTTPALQSNLIDQVEVIMDTNVSATNWNQISYGSTKTDIFDVITGGWLMNSLNPYLTDQYENNTLFDFDTNNGGLDNVIGSGSYNFTTQTYFYEIAQELNSTDKLNDIHVKAGDSFLILPAIYNDGNIFHYTNMANLTLVTQSFDFGPKISFLSPVQKSNFTSSTIPFDFYVNTTPSWIGYSLDNQANVTVNGNFSLSSVSNGQHTLKIYVNDSYGKTAVSSELTFSVDVASSSTPVSSSGSSSSSSTSSNSVTASSNQGSSQPSSSSLSSNPNHSNGVAGYTFILLILAFSIQIIYRFKFKKK